MMRPYQTIGVVILGLAVVALLTIQKGKVDPRIERFADCYVELALLHQNGDTSSAFYAVQKDSILSHFGFTERTLLDLKAEFDRDPLLLADIWEMIDNKLRARKEASDIVKP